MTVAELGRRMSGPEFMEWMAYAELEPFGPLRDDQRAGVVTAVLANVNRDPKRRSDPFQPSDFFASLAPPPPTPVDREARLKAWAASMNAARKPSKPRPKKAD